MEDRWHDILDELPRVREELGWPIMVTPLSQFVGVQAFLNVTTGERWSQLPDEVVRYVLGQYGPPAGEIDPDVRGAGARPRRGPRALRRREHGIGLDAARARYGDADQRRAAAAADDAAGGAGRGDAARRAPRRGALRRPHPLRRPRRRAGRARPAPMSRSKRPDCGCGPAGDAPRDAFAGSRRRSSSTSTGPSCTRTTRAASVAPADPGRRRGGRARPGDRPARPLLHERHRPAARRRYAADLRAVGFELADDEFMNPAVVAARWISNARHPGKSVLVLGGPGVAGAAEGPRHRGRSSAAEPRRADVVLVGWDDSLSYAALRAACESVWAGLRSSRPRRRASSPSAAVPHPAGPARSSPASARRRAPAPSRSASRPRSRCARCAACSAARRAARAVVGDDLALEIAMARRLGSAHRARPHRDLDRGGRCRPSTDCGAGRRRRIPGAARGIASSVSF